MPKMAFPFCVAEIIYTLTVVWARSEPMYRQKFTRRSKGSQKWSSHSKRLSGGLTPCCTTRESGRQMEGGSNRRVNVASFYGKADVPGRQTTAAGFQQEWKRRKSYNSKIGGVWGLDEHPRRTSCLRTQVTSTLHVAFQSRRRITLRLVSVEVGKQAPRKR
jgi:hypothetical protein